VDAPDRASAESAGAEIAKEYEAPYRSAAEDLVTWKLQKLKTSWNWSGEHWVWRGGLLRLVGGPIFSDFIVQVRLREVWIVICVKPVHIAELVKDFAFTTP